MSRAIRIISSCLLTGLALAGCHLASSLEGFADGRADAGGSLVDAAQHDATDTTTCFACGAPCADCDGAAANGCETNTNTSPDHCGACAHSCRGGACVHGSCVPLVLASAEPAPWAIASDGVSAYWVTEQSPAGDGAEGGTVRSVPLDGGPVTQLASGQPGPVDIAIANQFVYWANFIGAGAISRVPIPGGPIEVLIATNAPWAIAVDSDTVFWSSRLDGSINAMASDGSSSPVKLVSQGDSTELRGLSVDQNRVYWIDTAHGEIRSVSKMGGDIQTLLSGLVNPLDLAVSQDLLAWVEAGSSWTDGACSKAEGRVATANKLDGSHVVVIAQVQACPRAVAIDGADVFWVNHGLGIASYDEPGSVEAAAITGGEVRTLASGQPRPVDLVLLPDYVVWANKGLGTTAGSVARVVR